jgi:hypothetical protein
MSQFWRRKVVTLFSAALIRGRRSLKKIDLKCGAIFGDYFLKRYIFSKMVALVDLAFNLKDFGEIFCFIVVYSRKKKLSKCCTS